MGPGAPALRSTRSFARKCPWKRLCLEKQAPKKAEQLTVDPSFWTRYRSDSQNPDFGDTLPQAVAGLAAGEFPAIPRTDADLSPGRRT